MAESVAAVRMAAMNTNLLPDHHGITGVVDTLSCAAGVRVVTWSRSL
jgi:hypothetical protein